MVHSGEIQQKHCNEKTSLNNTINHLYNESENVHTLERFLANNLWISGNKSFLFLVSGKMSLTNQKQRILLILRMESRDDLNRPKRRCIRTRPSTVSS